MAQQNSPRPPQSQPSGGLSIERIVEILTENGTLKAENARLTAELAQKNLRIAELEGAAPGGHQTGGQQAAHTQSLQERFLQSVRRHKSGSSSGEHEH